VREERAPTTGPDGREERYTSVLPAWSARSEHDLTGAGSGISAAIAALGLDGYPYEAKQSAVARYSRFGFEAAAVTGFAVATGFVQPSDGLLRVADLRFGHPYAVVATAVQNRPDGGRGPWHGLPVFSAWVTEVEDAAGTA
jgi:hypothetical protein